MGVSMALGQFRKDRWFPMTSRLDAIKARAELVAGKPDNCEPTEKEWDALTDGAIHDVPALLAAVEAVLELHKEVGSWRSGVYQCGQCAELCHSTSGLGCEDPIDAVWPCPTVTAIQSALGEVGK